MPNLTWSSSTTSANPPAVESDAISLVGQADVQVSFHAHGTAGGGGMGINGTAHIMASPDGVTYSNLASVSVLAGIGATQNRNIGPVATLGNLFARLEWDFVTYNNGFFDTGIWTLTPQAALPVSRNPLGGSQALPNRALSIGTAANPNPYGVDIRCFDDLDPFFALVGGIEVLAQDLYHSITCSPGTVPGNPDTIDVRLLLNQSITLVELGTIQGAIISQWQSDERVESAQVTLEYLDGNLTISGTIFPLNPQGSSQPFQLVAGLTKIAANLLSVATVQT